MIINIQDYQSRCVICKEHNCEDCDIVLRDELNTFIIVNQAGFDISWDEFCKSDEWMDEYLAWIEE